jgi:hypothetical protein
MTPEPLRTGPMYIWRFWLNISSGIKSRNNDLNSWDILYIYRPIAHLLRCSIIIFCTPPPATVPRIPYRGRRKIFLTQECIFPILARVSKLHPGINGVLHSQTFTNRNDHWRFIVETATIQALLQWPKRMLVWRITVTSVQTFRVERIRQLFCPMH